MHFFGQQIPVLHTHRVTHDLKYVGGRGALKLDAHIQFQGGRGIRGHIEIPGAAFFVRGHLIHLIVSVGFSRTYLIELLRSLDEIFPKITHLRALVIELT
jgi:hypothetical protein